MSAHECIGCGQGGAKNPGKPGTWYWFEWLPRDKCSEQYLVLCERCMERAAKAMFQPKLIARPAADEPLVAELKQKIAILEEAIGAAYGWLAGICQGGISTNRHSDSGTKG